MIRFTHLRLLSPSMLFTCMFYSQGCFAITQDDLFSLSIEDLLAINVSSVTKLDQTLSEAPASMYVITNADIVKAGITTLPEALRLDPRIQIARLSANQYAISIRGFNNLVSNKLLVLLDGRTIYTPLFSGVFWDQQDTLIDDIDRIEVISGPGSTLWGANAVNGVINIITKTANKTVGGLVSAHAGTDERGVQARYGTHLGKSGHLRVYSKFFENDSTRRVTGVNALDGGKRVQTGFRADWISESGQFTLQGDIYDGKTVDRGVISGLTLGSIETSGANLLASWSKSLNGGSNIRIQTYWDYMKRRDAVVFQPKSNIVDIELQHDIPFNEHKFIWGLGYRYAEDEVLSGIFSTFIPDRKSLEWKNIFGSSQFQLAPKWHANLGIRVEENDYTGREYMPELRLSWMQQEDSLFWAALSRSIRSPSRYDKEVYFPAPPNSLVVGGPNFVSEVSKAFELGYRSGVWDRLTYSVTTFIQRWDRLRSATAIPVELENKIQGDVYGIEFWSQFKLTEKWQLKIGGTRVHKDLELEPGSTDPVGVANESLANDPDYHGQVRTLYQFNSRFSTELTVRHVAELPNPVVPDYTVVDLRMFWTVSPKVDLSLVGENIGDKRHREFGAASVANELDRMVWLKATWHP